MSAAGGRWLSAPQCGQSQAFSSPDTTPLLNSDPHFKMPALG